jgi:HD-like signal output (HDOD) protein
LIKFARVALKCEALVRPQTAQQGVGGKSLSGVLAYREFKEEIMSNQTDLAHLLTHIDTWMYKGDIFFSANADVTLRIRDMILNPDISLSKIAEYIIADPVLSSRVLALANSAAYNGKRTSVKEAVLALGASTLNYIAFSVMHKQILTTISGRAHYLMKNLWLHCLDIACSCYAYIKVRMPHLNADTAMLLGMVLHLDIMYIIYSSSKFTDIFSDHTAYSLVVRKISNRIHTKLMEMYHISHDIVDMIKPAYVPYNFQITPTTEADVVSMFAQCHEPLPEIKQLLPTVNTYGSFVDQQVLDLASAMRSILTP